MVNKKPSMNRDDVRRRQTAIELAEERAKRSSQEQLAILDHRLGVGMGAVKERARLQERLAKE